MADILIKGMEMPKAQFQKTSTLYHVEGTIFVYPDGKARAELSVDYKERKSYPLVPVPPHGDLVDRDETIEAGKSHPTYKNSKIVKAVVDKACCFLKTATVVIPANKED